MKALFFDGSLSVREVETPRPAPDEALIQVTYAGICGTDREILQGYSGFRGIPGHEFVGRVVECADATWVGKRVVGEINITCGHCDWCRRGRRRHCSNRTVMGIINRPGAFAEFVALPVANLHEVPSEVSDQAAVFTEPLAAAAEILEQMPIAPGTRIAVLGSGRLGLLIAQVLRNAQGDVTVIGRQAAKLDLARSWGLKTIDANAANAGEIRPTQEPALNAVKGSALQSLRTIDASHARDTGGGTLALRADGGAGSSPAVPAKSFAVVVEATGSPAGLDEALRLVEPLGTVVMKSTFHDLAHFDTAKLVVDEVTLRGSRCGDFSVALRLLREGRVRAQELISRVFPLEAGPEAFEVLNQPPCLKVLLAPSA
jgi:alcohol dehydrogenase